MLRIARQEDVGSSSTHHIALDDSSQVLTPLCHADQAKNRCRNPRNQTLNILLHPSRTRSSSTPSSPLSPMTNENGSLKTRANRRQIVLARRDILNTTDFDSLEVSRNTLG